MHETMNNQCFELTPLSRWYGQRHIVSLSRWNHERGDPRALEVSRNGRKSASKSCQAPMLIKMETLRASHALRRARPGAQRRRLTSSEEILRRQALLILSVLPTSERDHRAGKRHHRERDHRIGERDHGAQEGVREARSPSCTASSSPSMRWV